MTKIDVFSSKKSFITAILICLFSPVFLFSQGGSNYSAIGFGDFVFGDNAITRGMGGVSCAVANASSLNMQNPATWTGINTTRLNIGYLFNQNVVNTSDNSLWQNNGGVNGFTAALAVNEKYGITVGLGLKPLTRFRYYISNPVKIDENGIYAEGKTYYQGSGGLNDAFFGISGRLFGRVSVGAYSNFTFGRVTRTTESHFYSDITLYSPSAVTEDYLRGIGGTVGTMVDIGKGFAAGAFYKFAGQIKYDSETTIFGVNTATDTIITRPEGETEIPVKTGFGISYSNKRLTAGIDYTYQDFTDVDYGAGVDSKFRAASGIAVGLDIAPKQRRIKNYVETMAWRAGVSYRDLYYEVNSTDISELAFTLGTSIPAGESLVFDIGIVLGTRGTVSNSLVRENFGRLSVDFSIGETWFKRFERDYTVEED